MGKANSTDRITRDASFILSEAHHRSNPSILIQAHKYNNAASKLAALRILDEITGRPGIFPAYANARPREAVRRLPESSEVFGEPRRRDVRG